MPHFDQVKREDPYRFIKADDFFAHVDRNPSELKQPTIISLEDADQEENGQARAVCRYGRIFRLDDDEDTKDKTYLLIQFLRPRVWRVRFLPRESELAERTKDDPNGQYESHGPQFSDFNSRMTSFSTTSKLVENLDALEAVTWDVEHVDVPGYHILQSVMICGEGTERRRTPEVQLWIRKDPFQITATRLLQSSPPAEELPRAHTGDDETLAKLALGGRRGAAPAIIWQTKPRPLKYFGTSSVLSVQTSVHANFMGFGEQGGRRLFKSHTYMNYFNFDNMKYQNVYGVGPQDDREPLYHSEPYWMEVASHAGLRSLLSTVVDNYSQVCLDLRMEDETAIRIATRFNELNCMIAAADSVSELIQTYTSIVGKPRLKPRYALGYHQGCYGYDTKEMVLECARRYREAGFPLDGLHIDVDIQRDHRTFTIDEREGHFPDPVSMFGELRRMGVKCCTNITPHINSNAQEDYPYPTLDELTSNGYAIADRRDLHPQVREAHQERYQNYDVGRELISPATRRPGYSRQPDTCDLERTFNTGKPFRGGVFYGWGNGAPGHYPNLNSRDVRIWWGKQYKYLFECGLEFVWQDMTSPCIAEEYGDMKSLPFRLLLDCDTRSGERAHVARQKKAIELWSLYSYNLHKATYHGLEDLYKHSGKLEWRRGRRPFIIGRGSFVGSHRFAGLWTGDNQSTWDFLDISIVQVLALGLSGITISGQDVGGFEFTDAERDWVNPELLMRWYGAYSLLPWFRNHYTKYRTYGNGPHKGEMRKDGKQFQEPYAYAEHYEQNEGRYHGREAMLYRSVLPVCRYHVRLRYSLMQVLYDAMFENVITGLPIARSMVITDDQDRTLFTTNQDYTSHQYMVGNDLLVAPHLRPESESRSHHRLYLPYPCSWYPMNLEPDEPVGRPLEARVNGGTSVNYYCPIADQPERFPYITPMYIRGGAIIPKIEPRLSTPDIYEEKAGLGMSKPRANPITFHVYPGGRETSTYTMYLDDGISMNSEPLSEVPGLGSGGRDRERMTLGADKYCKVVLEQKTFIDEKGRDARRLSVRAAYNGYEREDYTLRDMVGGEYTAVFWHDGEARRGGKRVAVGMGGSVEGRVVGDHDHDDNDQDGDGDGGGDEKKRGIRRTGATVVRFGTEGIHKGGEIVITITYCR